MVEIQAESQSIWNLLKNPSQAQETSRWLRWHPSQLAECVRERAWALPAPLAEAELTEMRNAHQLWNAPPASLAALELLGQRTTRVVITGQQPSPLAGPLLVLYKALGAIHLARQLKEQFPDLNFVPVFWVASEDHDFDEIRRIYWPGHHGQLEQALLGHDGWKQGQMIGRHRVQGVLEPLLEQIGNSTFPTEFQDEVKALLREAFDEKSTLETSFARILLRLLGGMGLVIVSPLMRWLRKRSSEILRKEFANPGSSSRQVIDRGEALRAAGITPALHRHASAVNAFWVDATLRRHSLRLHEGQVRRQVAGEEFEKSGAAPLDPLPPRALNEMLETDPTQFSTNVITRPLTQDHALPTVAQVVGPGEAAYLAQVEAVYRDFGVFTPVRWPRPEALLIEPRIVRNLQKYKLGLDEALDKDEQSLTRMLMERDREAGPAGEIEALHQRHAAELQALRERLAGGDGAIASAFDKLAQMMEKGYGTVAERVLYQRQHDERHLVEAMALIANSLRPAGNVQERVFNPLVPYAINYGLNWTEKLAEALPRDPYAPGQRIELGALFGNGK